MKLQLVLLNLRFLALCDVLNPRLSCIIRLHDAESSSEYACATLLWPQFEFNHGTCWLLQILVYSYFLPAQRPQHPYGDYVHLACYDERFHD